jgi:hypothetical protein
VKYVDCSFKPHCINGPERIAPEIFNHFEDPRSLALPRLGPWVLATKLGYTERDSDPVFHSLRKIQQVCFGRAYPEEWLFAGYPAFSRHVNFASFRIYESIGFFSVVYAPRSAASFFKRASLLIR